MGTHGGRRVGTPGGGHGPRAAERGLGGNLPCRLRGLDSQPPARESAALCVGVAPLCGTVTLGPGQRARTVYTDVTLRGGGRWPVTAGGK